MSTRRFDAIVIGAGPAGASSAILLAAAGWSVAVVEKQPFPRRKVCGECVAASNLGLLDALGVGRDVAAFAGPPLTKVALMQGRHTIVADLPELPGRHRWGRALARTDLDPLLLERARRAGATIFQPWSLRACDGRPGDWRCTIAAGEPESATTATTTADATATLSAPVVIAAHGSWQRLAAANRDVERPRRPADLFAFKADFVGGALADGLLPVLSFEGGYGGLVRGADDVATFAGCIRRDALDAARRARPGGTAGEAFERHVRSRCFGVDAALADASRTDPWLAAGPIRPGIRIGRDPNGPFLVGNAAGEAHPIVGEGISMALQSAWLLCARLIADHGRGTLQRAGRDAAWARTQRRYTTDWHHHFSMRIRLAAALSHLAMRPAWSGTLLPLLVRRPAFLADAARASGKLRCAVDAGTIAAISPRPHSATTLETTT